jgi:IclR family pca regulon transcriptional regulator
MLVSPRVSSPANRPDGGLAFPTLSGPGFSQSVEYGLAILKCFTGEHPELGISDIADALGMSRSTTHRYVITLVKLGYLEQVASRKYRLSLRPTDLGMVALNSTATGLRDAARPYLEKLRDSTGYSVGLGVLDGAQVVYMDHLRNLRYGQAADGPNIRVGVRVPAYCTSIGKLLLAFLSQEDRESILAETSHTQRTGRTITQKEAAEAASGNLHPGLRDQRRRVPPGDEIARRGSA